MKLRTTTPASNLSFAARVAVTISVIIMAVALPIQFFAGKTASADDYDAKIQALRNKISGYENEASALRAKADTLQNALSQITNDKTKIQTEVDLKQAEYDKLVKEIKDTENRIKENKQVSGKLIVESSLSGDVPLIVRLASSDSLADYIDGEASRISVRDMIVKKTEENEKLKAQLKDKQAKVKKVLDEQTLKRNELAAKEAAQAQLLAETKGSESAYQNLISDSNEKIKELKRQQDAQRQAASGWGGGFVSVGGTGGYPYICGNYPCWRAGYVDPWGLYYQECVSYVAWKLDSEGYGVSHFRGAGNATQWPSTASYASWRYGSPKVGDAMVRLASSSWDPGHISYVESVSPNGTIVVSEYNFRVDGQYTERSLSPSQYSGLMFGTFPRR